MSKLPTIIAYLMMFAVVLTGVANILKGVEEIGEIGRR